MGPVVTKVKLFTSPDRREVLYARFDTRLVGAGEGDPKRAKHVVYKDPNGECYVHYAHYLVPESIPPIDEPGLHVSERIFFGKWRIVEESEAHLPETWTTIGDTVDKMESIRRMTGR